MSPGAVRDIRMGTKHYAKDAVCRFRPPCAAALATANALVEQISAEIDAAERAKGTRAGQKLVASFSLLSLPDASDVVRFVAEWDAVEAGILTCILFCAAPKDQSIGAVAEKCEIRKSSLLAGAGMPAIYAMKRAMCSVRDQLSDCLARIGYIEQEAAALAVSPPELFHVIIK